MNYFTPHTAADRYSKGRPNFHNTTINHIKSYLKLENKLHSALDIACGTGLSTQALLNIATHVYGTDGSQAMLDFALKKDKINYQIARAEVQPFANQFFDLITVCSGVHWFDIDKFLMEANRLLKSKSYLVLYDNFFLGEMESNPEFLKWYNSVYLINFPAPARNDNYNWINKKLNEMNFDYVKEEIFTNAVSFNKNELLLYFTTQSNIISAVEKKLITYPEVEVWLDNELSIHFANENKNETVHFSN
ncbi:MAG: methyltransferase domain-containing protein [Saprospiraceae bacterium]|nr:methyltransferase domain-containing protein [Saprospiraceae bacterium]